MSKSFPDHINYALLGANAAVISGIFIFFAIASQSVASNLFSINADRCSFGLDITPDQGEMAVAISGGLLIIPFAISSMLVLLRNDQHANLVATIGFGLMVVAASMILVSLSCRMPTNFILYVILLPASLTILAVYAITYWRKRQDLTRQYVRDKG
jgi:hypothetical protein